MVEVKLTPSGRGVASLADRERVSTPAVPERVAPASASRSGPVLRVRCTKDGAGNSVVLFCDDLGAPPAPEQAAVFPDPFGPSRIGRRRAANSRPARCPEPGLVEPTGNYG
jgi:hypothetical protein